MTKTGRPPLWEAHRDEWVRLYTDEQRSRGQIAREYGTSVQSVTRQLRAAGVDLEARVGDNPNAGRTPERQAEINAKISESRMGKGTGPRVERETRQCQNPRCPIEEYEYVPGKTGEKYCSKNCQMSVQGQRTAAEARAEYDSDPQRCPCGEAIPYEHRHTRQYCTPEHRKQYQAKRQKDPEKQVTFICQNETCPLGGEPVTRPQSWGKGYFKYCSNECARKHTKTRKFYAVEGFEVVFESSWEVLFWGLCQFRKIPVERTDRNTGVQWKPGAGGWYSPDFHLPRSDIYVEVKGQQDEHDQSRWATFRAEWGHLVVVDEVLMNQLLWAQNRTVMQKLLADHATR